MADSVIWVPGNAPLDEAYWEALLADGDRECGAWEPSADRALGPTVEAQEDLLSAEDEC